MKFEEITDNEINLLQYGVAGSGKTCAASTFPKPIYYADCDKGVKTLKAFHRGNPKALEDIEFDYYTDVRPENPEAYRKLNKRIDELTRIARDNKEFPYATLILDSLTTLEDILMNDIKRELNKSNRIRGNATQQDYGILINELEELIPKLVALPCNVVVNCHIQTVQDGITQEIFRLPLVTGKKLPHKLSIWFDEVYRAHVDDKGNHVWQVKSDYKYSAKTRSIPKSANVKEIPQDYKEIEKYIKG